jgi:hypothetical protein
VLSLQLDGGTEENYVSIVVHCSEIQTPDLPIKIRTSAEIIGGLQLTLMNSLNSVVEKLPTLKRTSRGME